MSMLQPLAGGLMIGLAAVLLLKFNGRLMGVSGIFFSALTDSAEGSWRWLFLIGMVAGAWVLHAVSGLPVPAPSDSGSLVAIVAGLIVGFGTRLGGGCTSGHGVCGIGRLSVRSITATLVFMAVGILTVFVVRHLLGGLL
ncbi:YeeE/YedE family protein [Aestuariirhabdus haliotis]|uniref:YeeE/YedE family protein n=1 Tax=Aestuariirhabdus haliotis TaxID=2918751 RepID=UPI0029E7D919|nr:YeeE/YedE thiosulfate transporter family protein [Aestuariirhabdus haliotis]